MEYRLASLCQIGGLKLLMCGGVEDIDKVSVEMLCWVNHQLDGKVKT